MKLAVWVGFLVGIFTGVSMGAVPANVQFVSASTGSASVSWQLDAPSSETPWAAISQDPTFSTFFSSAALALGQQATGYYGLFSNATYYFTVKVATEPDSAYSVPVSTLTPPQEPQGAAVLGLGPSGFTLGWNSGNNAAGTQYWAEVSMDDAFAITSVSSGTGLTALYTGLNPDSTYFMRVRALGAGGQDSGFVTLSTITLPYQPGAGDYALVGSTGMSVFWDGNGNPAWTRYLLQVSTDGFSSLDASTVTPGNYYEAGGLQPNTTFYFRAAAYGWGGAYSAFTAFGSTLTYAAAPADNPPDIGSPGPDSVPVQWSPNGNPGYTEYYVGVATSADFLGTDFGPRQWAAGPALTVTGLYPATLFYFRVRARDSAGRTSGWLYLGSAVTLSGADTVPPSVIDLQPGDDVWRGSVSGSYNVQFSDYGSLLARFQVLADTGPAFSGTAVSTWTDVVTGIDAAEYNTPWMLPPQVFTAIQQDVTTYVSVRVYDNAGNSTVYPDAFYVLRDTTQPTLADNAVSPQGWLSSDPGPVFDVEAADALSGLQQFLYSASAVPGAADGAILPWTSVPGFSPGPSYAAPWGVDFAALRDGVTNYISVRAVDAAGNARTYADAFKLLKNTLGPPVVITSPGGAWVSTVTAFSGTASPMVESSPPVGTQVSLRELAGGLYYDGASFSSASQVWLDASGTATWSYDASTVPFAQGTEYALTARARDSSGLLTASPYPSVTFQLDQQAPSVWVSTPLPAGSTVYSLDTVQGTAADSGPAGLYAVDIYVKSLADGKWWNFATDSWGGVPVASATAAGASWTFTPGSGLRGAVASGRSYFVAAVAEDAALPPNVTPFGAAGSTFTWVDTVPPDAVTAFAPSTGTSPGRIDLAWTFPGDDGGQLALTYGQYAVQYSTFAAAAFSTGTAQVLISTAMVQPGAYQSYTLSGLQPETTYYLRMWVLDDGGNWSGPSSLSSTLSGNRLNDTIAGTVKTPAGTGVTGVIVDAVNGDGVIAATSYTLDDGLGSFSLTPLPDGIYRVQATWVQDGFASAVAKDEVPMGYADADFVLSLDYQLASVSGVLSPASAAAGPRPSSSGGEAQLWRGTRMLARALPDLSGRFAIRNLIPGEYTLRVTDGGAWKTLDINLAPGQDLQLKPLGTLLDKASVYAYPDPASAWVTFHVQSGIFPARVKISVFSLDGRLVQKAEGEINSSAPYEYRWDFSGRAPASGVYFYTVRLADDLGGNSSEVTRKFAVVR